MMILHQDKDAFKVLLSDIHNRTGYRLDVLEKDYYVTLVLEELAGKQNNGLMAFFKGGTALYKALKNIRRFSEDIDLSVDTRECTRTQADKRLRQATKEYDSVSRDKEGGFTNRSEVITIYTYGPQTEYDLGDALQRFGRIKVEATSFTISEPYESMEITPLLFDASTEEQKQILIHRYAVVPFNLLTITLERIFIDKLFAAEAYTRNANVDHRAFDAAKHIYDLCVLSENARIQDFLKDKAMIEKIIGIRLIEEKERLDGIPNIPFDDFTFYSQALKNPLIEKAYETMQNLYVFKPEDRISIKEAERKLYFLLTSLSISQKNLKNSLEKTKSKERELER